MRVYPISFGKWYLARMNSLACYFPASSVVHVGSVSSFSEDKALEISSPTSSTSVISDEGENISIKSDFKKI